MSKSQPSFSAQLVSASADQALAALTEAGAHAPALVDAWVAAGNAAAVRVAADSSATAVRKTARRALNVLKARGVAIPTDKRVARPTKAEAKRTWEAWLMAPDGSGTFAIVIATRAPAGRYRACFSFAHDSSGIFRIETGDFSASALREATDRLIQGAGYKPVKVPVAWARARIASCRAAHLANHTPEPLGLKRAAELIEPAPASAPAHPFDEEGLELALEDAQEMAQHSGVLHQLPEFRAWFPTKPALDELLLEIGLGLEPGRDPTPEELREVIDAKVLEATDRYFSPQRKEDLLRSMKDAALSVLAREGEQKALEVAAVMTVIDSSGLITNPPSDVEFLRGFFHKSLSLMAARDGGALRIPIPGRGLPVETPEQGADDPATAEAAAPATATQPAEAHATEAAAGNEGAASAGGLEESSGGDPPGEPSAATPSVVDNEW